MSVTLPSFRAGTPPEVVQALRLITDAVNQLDARVARLADQVAARTGADATSPAAALGQNLASVQQQVLRLDQQVRQLAAAVAALTP